MALPFRVDARFLDAFSNGAAQRLRRRFSKRLSVAGSKPSQFVEPVVGGDAGDRSRPGTRIAEGTADCLESLDEHAALGSHPAHAVERVAEAALAEPDDATEAGQGHRPVEMRPQVGFGVLDGLLPRGHPIPEGLLTARSASHGRQRYLRPERW
jgi:hypothetical protein